MLNLREAQLIAGKYRLLRPLAKGGMGSVWIAKHIALNVPVAVKFMDPRYVDLDDLRARFEREALAAAQLRIPNVVQIYDYGVEMDMPYIVMEFLHGEDLGARLAREGRLSVHDAVVILSQICKALRRAHDEGIVHRDLKPANVFLVVQDDELLVKVLDFGIAKVLRSDSAEDATKTGEVIGSPAYMSPEQVRGIKEIDHRTDLWSLGVIAYRVLTGELPFPGSNTGDMFVKICTDEPVAPSTIVSELDARVDTFISKALAKIPGLRFSSAKEMADALAELDRWGLPRGPFQSVPFTANVDSATNAPVISRVVPKEHRKRPPLFVGAAFVGIATALVIIVAIAIWISQRPAPLESSRATAAASRFNAAAENDVTPIPLDVPSAIPNSSAPMQASATPPSTASMSSKSTSGPRKTTSAGTPKPSANYSLRKDL